MRRLDSCSNWMSAVSNVESVKRKKSWLSCLAPTHPHNVNFPIVLRSFKGNKGPVQSIIPSGKASEDSPKTHDGSALVDLSTSCKDEIPRAIIKIGQISSNHFELHLSCQRYHREREHT